MAAPSNPRPRRPKTAVEALKAVRIGLRLIDANADRPSARKTNASIMGDLQAIVDDAIAEAEARS